MLHNDGQGSGPLADFLNYAAQTCIDGPSININDDEEAATTGDNYRLAYDLDHEREYERGVHTTTTATTNHSPRAGSFLHINHPSHYDDRSLQEIPWGR